MTPEQLTQVEKRAKELRYQLVKMLGYGAVHHYGGSLSLVEIVASLYFYKMRYDPQNPKWPDRDRLIMSKGHSVPVQYAALALAGLLPLETLPTLKTLGSILQGHPNAWLTPGIEACTGSLGQGLSFANGVALMARLLKKDVRAYVLLGDGELHEGQVWEAAMTSASRGLDNLVAIVDNNRLKSQGPTAEAKPLEPLADKWAAFGWHTLAVDGHNVGEVCQALDAAETVKGKPTVILARTVKGKGVSALEGQYECHNIALSQAQWQAAMQEVTQEA